MKVKLRKRIYNERECDVFSYEDGEKALEYLEEIKSFSKNEYINNKIEQLKNDIIENWLPF